MNGGVDPTALLGVGGGCGLVLVLAETVHRQLGVAAEWTRKLAHVLMGLIACAFPWLLPDPRAVVLLCALFAVLLGATLGRAGLPSIHRVGRRTVGALCFPLAVAVVFLGADRRTDFYVTAMLVLALADPAAALVGRHLGAHRFGPGPDAKSLEGSLAFFAVAAACVYAGADAPLAWALGVGAVLAAVEAASPFGSDNVFVPVGALLLLQAIPGA